MSNRRISTREEKIAAVEHVRSCCERQRPVFNGELERRYGVSKVINILLKGGVIDIRNKEKALYTWKETSSVPDIVSILWKHHGRHKETISVEEHLANASNEHHEMEIAHTVLAVSRTPEVRTLESEVAAALERCKTYGIANVSQYIADHLRHMDMVK